MNPRLLKRFYPFAVLAVASALTLLVWRPVVGQDDRDEREHRKLAGTWNVTLKFPECTDTCPCPGGVPNIPIPALHRYGRDGSILEVPGGVLFRGPGVGSWERLGHDDFAARFKFFIFNPNGSRSGSEEVTNHIELTGPDAFEANATFDLFDATGNIVGQGCVINETATRFD